MSDQVITIYDAGNRKERLRKELEKGSVRMLHFKGSIYLVLAIVEHTETGEELVAYKRILSDIPNDPLLKKTWVRPIDMFLSPVDFQKYPDSQFDYRFMFEDDARAELSQLLGGTTGNCIIPTDELELKRLRVKYQVLHIERKEDHVRYTIDKPISNNIVEISRTVNDTIVAEDISIEELSKDFVFAPEYKYE